MARLKGGILGPITGKLANLVGYVRLGEAIVRTVAKKSRKKGKRSDAQRAVNLKFSMVKSFISSMNDFIKVGFRLEVLGTTKIAENDAVSYNIKNAITGNYPELTLDYSKALISKGKLPLVDNAVVEYVDGALKFNWDVNPEWTNRLRRDQVMMLAYLPANNRAQFCVSGARRLAGEDLLPVKIQKKSKGNIKKDEFIEAYIAFISDDRQNISDSCYVGRIAL